MNILRVLLGSALTKPQPTASDLNVVHTISRAGSELKPVFLDVSALQPFGPWGPLPKDIWTIIFGFMEVKNLRRLLFVNKSFARQTVVTFLKIKKTRPDVRSIKSSKWTLPCADNAALAVYPNGDLMIVTSKDATHSEVMVLDADFKVVKCIKNPKPLRDTKVQCCTIAEDGRLFFADHASDKILVTDSEVSKLLCSFGPVHRPWGLEMDFKNKQLIVADAESNRIAMYDLDGKFVRSFGGSGKARGQLQFPNQMHLDAATDTLTVVEMNNNRLQRFSFRDGVPKELLLEGSLACPCGVEIDSTGRLYLADCHNHRIVVFEPSGQMVHEWKSTSVGNGRALRGPHRIRMRDDGTLIVKDWDAFYAF